MMDITKISREEVAPAVYGLCQRRHPTKAAAKRSFSMLNKEKTAFCCSLCWMSSLTQVLAKSFAKSWSRHWYGATVIALLKFFEKII